MLTDDLRCFWALTERQSAAKAAQDMGISPQTLLSTIKTLEQHMGARLMESRRGSRGLRLTRSGETLKTLIPQIFSEQARLRDQVRVAGEPSLRVALSGAGALLEAETLARLRPSVESARASAHLSESARASMPLAESARASTPLPESAFSLIRTSLTRQITGIWQGEFDLGLSQTARTDQDRGLIIEAAWREPLVAMLPRTHLLAAQEIITLDMLTLYPLVVEGRDGEGYGEQVSHALQTRGLIEAGLTLEKAATSGDATRAVLAGGIWLSGMTQWSHSSLVTNTVARPVAQDKTTGKPLWLTTYLRRPTVVNPVLNEVMARFMDQISQGSAEPIAASC